MGIYPIFIHIHLTGISMFKTHQQISLDEIKLYHQYIQYIYICIYIYTCIHHDQLMDDPSIECGTPYHTYHTYHTSEKLVITCRRQAMMTKRNADLYREAVLVFPSYTWPAMVKVSHGKWLRFLMASHA